MSDNSKKLILIMLFFLGIVIIVPLFIYLQKDKAPSTAPKQEIQKDKGEIEQSPENQLLGLEESIESSRALGRLPMGEEKIGFDFSQEDESLYIEYVSFLDFYKEIKDEIEPTFEDYSLPLNIKTDVVNYYDLSRRLNIDPYLDELNSSGVALMSSSLIAKNFYDVYEELYSKRVPFFVTSDFLIYYHQQSMKKIFKDIEQNIFYKNLWDINYILFEKSKKRYEDSLAKSGNVNDRVLEAERLSAAYFATSLELLKPKLDQVAQSGDLSNSNLFGFLEKDIYSFDVPSYLQVDVSKEVELILAKNSISKSPVLLYERNYKEFEIPSEYSVNAKLNNFYLATKWLSSTFPLHYKGGDCPDCYLDFDDWRISMISSAFIANDIFNSHDLKNDWARIYKTLSFFKGLRGDLTYVHYRDALAFCFGENYDISQVFADDNSESVDNLYKFQSKILEYDFLKIEGSFDKNKAKDKPMLGVKMLSDFYWPNDFIFNELSYPKVSDYQSEKLAKNNITGCKVEKKIVRCNGFSLDIVSLIFNKDLKNNEYYQENSKYDNYDQQLESLKEQISKFPQIWHYNNYWQGLKITKNYLESNKDDLPIYCKSSDWELKSLYTAVGSWVNLQLPVENLLVNQKYQRGISSSSDLEFIKYNYIEPNLDLINEQLSSTLMVYEMFSLLKITEELRSVFMDLEDLKVKLEKIKEIMIKELKGEELSLEDLTFISILAREYKTEKVESRVLALDGENGKRISYDISAPKLVTVVFRRGGANYMAVGPVFSYIEK
jgi:hypothetical protein